MCHWTKCTVKKPTIRTRKDGSRETESLTYPLMAAADQRQVFLKQKMNLLNTLEETNNFLKIILQWNGTLGNPPPVRLINSKYIKINNLSSNDLEKWQPEKVFSMHITKY